MAWNLESIDQPLVFAGRHGSLDVNAPVLTDPLPRAIARRTPSHWIVCDPWTFPADYLTDRQWDAPLDVVLTSGLDTEAFRAALHVSVLSRLTPFDTVVSSRADWGELNDCGRLSAQWLEPDGAGSQDIEVVTRQLLRRARTVYRLAETLAESPVRLSQWNVRIRENKAKLRSESAILEPIFCAALDRQQTGLGITVLEIGADSGRYLPGLMRPGVDLEVVRLEPGIADQVRFNYPSIHVLTLGRSMFLGRGPETVDIVMASLQFLAIDSAPRDALFRRLWTALRVGGSMLVVQRHGLHGDTTSGFLEFVAAHSSGSAVLEALHGVRNPQTGLYDAAIYAFRRIGVPATW